jgi:mono/diheme cytochrome c family protein
MIAKSGNRFPAFAKPASAGEARSEKIMLNFLSEVAMPGFRAHVIVAAVAVCLGPGGALAASAEHGKAAFMQNGCWQCHGTMGQGSIATSGGKRLAPNPMPWEAFSGFVRSSNREMPPYSEKMLSDADLADIYAYLQAVPKPPDANSIQLLKP